MALLADLPEPDQQGDDDQQGEGCHGFVLMCC